MGWSKVHTQVQIINTTKVDLYCIKYIAVLGIMHYALWTKKKGLNIKCRWPIQQHEGVHVDTISFVLLCSHSLLCSLVADCTDLCERLCEIKMWVNNKVNAGTPSIKRATLYSSRLLPFHWTLDLSSFFLIFPYLDPVLPYHMQIHQTASFISLIPYPPYLRSSLALSSGALLILLSMSDSLSCTIHQPTKQCYYRLGLCLLALVALPAQSRLRVYKMYHYSTWTLSLSFHTIETSKPESKELHKSVDLPVSLLSAAA